MLRYTIEKGPITVAGVSLTVVDVDDDGFSVTVIPHTQEVTSLGSLDPASPVNLEADVFAKYVEKLGFRGASGTIEGVHDDRRPALQGALSELDSSPFATVDEAVDEIRAGRMVVVVDSPDRENEGDLVMAAECVTPDGDQLHGDPRPRPDLPVADAASAATSSACR